MPDASSLTDVVGAVLSIDDHLTKVAAALARTQRILGALQRRPSAAHGGAEMGFNPSQSMAHSPRGRPEPAGPAPAISGSFAAASEGKLPVGLMVAESGSLSQTGPSIASGSFASKQSRREDFSPRGPRGVSGLANVTTFVNGFVGRAVVDPHLPSGRGVQLHDAEVEGMADALCYAAGLNIVREQSAPLVTLQSPDEAGGIEDGSDSGIHGPASTALESNLRLDAAGEDAYLERRNKAAARKPNKSLLISQSSMDMDEDHEESLLGASRATLNNPPVSPTLVGTAAPTDLSPTRSAPGGEASHSPAVPVPTITPPTPCPGTLLGQRPPVESESGDAGAVTKAAAAEGFDRTPKGLVKALLQMVLAGNAAQPSGPPWDPAAASQQASGDASRFASGPASARHWTPFAESPRGQPVGGNQRGSLLPMDVMLGRLDHQRRLSLSLQHGAGAGTSQSSSPALLARRDSMQSMYSMAGGARPPPQLTTDAIVGDEEFDGTSTINQYVLLSSIGRGAQGEVMLAMDTNTNELRAIKVVSRPPDSPMIAGPDSPEEGPMVGNVRSALLHSRRAKHVQLQREIAAMKRCRHRNIVALYEVIDDPAVHSLYLVMQYVDHGSLVTMRKDGTPSRTIAPDVLAGYTRQLCAGLLYLHNHGIVHRDIKPDNILLGADDVVYLSDFGVSDVFDEGSSKEVAGTRGTHAFVAPELLDSPQPGKAPGGAAGSAVDVWALGMTLYVLLYGTLPWPYYPGRVADYLDHVISSPIGFSDSAANSAPVDPSWKSLLQGMLEREPTRRLTTEGARARVKAICEATDSTVCATKSAIGADELAAAIVKVDRSAATPSHVKSVPALPPPASPGGPRDSNASATPPVSARRVRPTLPTLPSDQTSSKRDASRRGDGPSPLPKAECS